MPLLFAVKLTPAGNEPDSLKVGVGKPVLFTLKENAAPTVAWADAAEVIAGAWSTVRVKDCVVVPALPFAFKVTAYVPPVCAAADPGDAGRAG